MCCRKNSIESNYSVYLHPLPKTQLENGITLKVVTIGTYAIGKTQLIRALVDEQFSADSTSTIGVGMHAGRLNEPDEPVAYKAIFWDTAGQDRFDTITVGYYRDTNVVLLCYDLSAGESQTELLQGYVEKIKHNCKESPAVILVGTKQDIEQPKQSLPLLDFEFVKTSAKTRSGIAQLRFLLLKQAKLVYNKRNNLLQLEAMPSSE